MLHLGHAGAGVDLLHLAVGAHGVGRAGHQHLALVHHGDGVGEAEHAVDIVLDDQDRNIGGDVLDEVRTRSRSAAAKARQRLVQQQHLRLGAERDAEIDQPLPAIGQFAALDGLDPFKAEELDQLRGLGVDIAVVVDIAPEVEAPGVLRLQRQAQVFVDRQPLEQIGDLERAGQSLVADRLRRHALDLAAIQLDGAAVGRVEAGDEIEQRGLSRAVRPDQRVDLAGADLQARIGDRANAAEGLGDAAHVEHGAVEPLRQQEGRQRQAVVDFSLAHRSGFFRRRPPAFCERRPDADEAARRIQHEGDEDQAEPQQPVRRPDRKQFAEQDEEQRADRRPQHAAHAADHDDREQLAGERHRDRFGGDEVVLESDQPAGKAGDDRRDHEDAELVALDRVALEGGAQLVLADRHQHMAERRAHQPQQQIEHAEAEHGDDDVIVQRIVEAEWPDAATLQAAEAILAAGDRGPAEGDGVGQRRQRQRQQREIDAAPAQDDEADEGRDHSDDDRRQQQRQEDVVVEPVALDQPGRIGADAEPGAVAERDQPGVADAEVEPHRRDGKRHHHGAGVERQPEQI